MIGIVKLDENDEKYIEPLTADSGSGCPLGTIIAQYSQNSVNGYLYLDGSTFDATLYPALYAYLGTTTLPDYTSITLDGKTVYWYIKATTGLTESEATDVLNTFENFSFQKASADTTYGFDYLIGGKLGVTKQTFTVSNDSTTTIYNITFKHTYVVPPTVIYHGPQGSVISSSSPNYWKNCFTESFVGNVTTTGCTVVYTGRDTHNFTNAITIIGERSDL